jgi:hypothetical protein
LRPDSPNKQPTPHTPPYRRLEAPEQGAILGEIKSVGTELVPHRGLQAVAALLDDLGSEDA